jgi:predicted ArsR family transcriptional regulator
MAEFETGEGGMPLIVEHHSPIAAMQEAYPELLHRLEEELVGRVLDSRVEREQTSVSGLYKCTFRIVVE